MPVFDFNATPDEKKPAECTYTVIRSNENEATIEKPMMILDNKQCKWEHHSCGVFTNPIKRTSFEFQQEDGTVSADILKIDARFVSLLKWLGENHINVRLSGENTEEGYAVYKIREIAFGGGTKLSAEDGFLQFMIERLLASNAPAEEENDEDEDDFLTQFENGELGKFLRVAIDKLPPQKQKICLLKIEYGLSNQEIADRMGITVPTVKSHYTQAIKALRNEIESLIIWFPVIWINLIV